ncbi:MAG TPA: PAS domain-containing sensor histidine kinase [Ignavibacteriales bacterium]|nr:PAS domain-containing sensor histidine kinase [Ignavibacteriales bacterium]
MPSRKEIIRRGNTQIKKTDTHIIEDINKLGDPSSLLSALFSAAKESIIIFDDLGNIRGANPAAISFLDYAHDELLNLNIKDLLLEKNRKSAYSIPIDLLSEPHSIRRFCIKAKHMLEIPIKITAERNFAKELHFIIFDASYEDKEEFSKKEYEEYKLIKNMFEFSYIGVTVYNVKGDLIILNKSCLEMWGLENEEEIKGINLFNLPIMGPELRNALEMGTNTQIEISVDFDIIRQKKIYATSRQGTAYFNLSLTILKQNGNKNITGYMLHLQDITRRKFIEKQLLDYNRELIDNKAILEEQTKELTKLNERLEISERKLLNMNAKRDKFFSILAHDLKTPFHSLLGFSEYLINYSSEMSMEELQEFSASMYKSTQKVFNLLENLLQWSRFQTGRFTFTPSRWKIYDLIEQVIELYSDSAKQKKIRIDNLADKEHYVFADSNMANTILRNLLSNAIKFSFPGGSVQISSVEKPNYIEITVSDNGKGMSSETLKNLFKVESKVSTEGTAKEMGTGLGLIICKEFIKKNKGMIKAESQEGKGSVFTFSLPKEKAKG